MKGDVDKGNLIYTVSGSATAGLNSRGGDPMW